mgnify:CR=1 FL=1
MQKNKSLLILVIMAFVAAGGYFGYVQFYLPQKFHKLTEKMLATAISHLSEEARAGQVIHIAIPGQELNEENRKVLTALRPGGIIFLVLILQTPRRSKSSQAICRRSPPN